MVCQKTSRCFHRYPDSARIGQEDPPVLAIPTKSAAVLVSGRDCAPLPGSDGHEAANVVRDKKALRRWTST